MSKYFPYVYFGVFLTANLYSKRFVCQFFFSFTILNYGFFPLNPNSVNNILQHFANHWAHLKCLYYGKGNFVFMYNRFAFINLRINKHFYYTNTIFKVPIILISLIGHNSCSTVIFFFIPSVPGACMNNRVEKKNKQMYVRLLLHICMYICSPVPSRSFGSCKTLWSFP